MTAVPGERTNLTAALQALEQAGSAQHRKIYARHALAEQLWATGNHDARVLATMIADPQQVTSALLDQRGLARRKQ